MDTKQYAEQKVISKIQESREVMDKRIEINYNDQIARGVRPHPNINSIYPEILSNAFLEGIVEIEDDMNLADDESLFSALAYYETSACASLMNCEHAYSVSIGEKTFYDALVRSGSAKIRNKIHLIIKKKKLASMKAIADKKAAKWERIQTALASGIISLIVSVITNIIF